MLVTPKSTPIEVSDRPRVGTGAPAGAGMPRRRRVVAIVGWGAAFAALSLYALSFRDTYVDDAYITLQYARNLAEHGTWGFFPDRATNTATSPLNVVRRRPSMSSSGRSSTPWPG